MMRALPSRGMQLLKLVRKEDPSGTSGLGHVAEVVVFSSGACVLSWLTRPTSLGLYNSLEDMMLIHGHGGRTVVEPDKQMATVMVSGGDDSKETQDAIKDIADAARRMMRSRKV